MPPKTYERLCALSLDAPTNGNVIFSRLVSPVNALLGISSIEFGTYNSFIKFIPSKMLAPIFVTVFGISILY